MKCKFSSILFRILLVAYIGAVAYLCFARPDRLPDMQRNFFNIPADKLAHFAMFFPLPIIAFFAYDRKTTGVWISLATVISVCAFSAIIAGITEIIQGALPYRSEDINDFGADCLAICISGVLVFFADLIRHRHKPSRSRKH